MSSDKKSPAPSRTPGNEDLRESVNPRRGDFGRDREVMPSRPHPSEPSPRPDPERRKGDDR